MASEDLEVKIGANIDNLMSELKKSKAELSKFGNDVDSLADRMKKAGEKMKTVGRSLSTFVTLPIVALGGASIKMASDLQESFNKVDVAFKESSSLVKDFAKDTLQSFGIAEGSALEMAALFGDMATGMGTATDEAADLSVNLVGLAGDLASFKNINIKEVTTALSGVFTGETESLKRLGIVMTQANLKAFALSEGINSNVEAMSQAEKIQLRYNYILSVTKNAQGDFTRTQGDSANQMRIFSEGVKELSASFGKILLPLFTKIVTKANDLINSFINLDDSTKKIIVVIAGIAAVLGPLLLTLGFISATAIPAMITGLGLLSTAFGFVTSAVTSLTVAMLANPIGLLVTGIVGLGFALVKLVQYLTDASSAWKTFKNILKSVFNPMEFMRLQTMDQADETEELQKKQKEQAVESRKNTIQQLNDQIKLTSAIKKTTDAIKEQNNNRPKATGLDVKPKGVTNTDLSENSLSSVVPSFEKLSEDEARFAEHQVKIQQGLSELNEGANEIINNSIAGTFGNLGMAIGNALATGGNVLKASGKSLLSSLGAILVDLGKMAIGIGIGIKGIKAALKTLNPIAAIGAGVALVALGSFFSATAGGIGDSIGSGQAGITQTPSSVQGFQGGGTNFGNSGGSNSLQNVVFEIQGTKLVGVISNTLSRNKSLSGNLSLG
jgi:hypothetical protein